MMPFRTSSKEKIKKIYDPRVSTFHWLKQLGKAGKNHEEILNRFEKDYHEISSSKVDPDADPVNILCIGGGGMKGKKLLIVHLVSW